MGLLVPLVATTASSAGAAPSKVLPPGLAPTQVNVSNDNSLRYGEPDIAVNPNNPNNLVYNVLTSQYTYQCQAAQDPNCTQFSLGNPSGQCNVPGFLSTRVFVTSNRGRSWSKVNFPAIPELRTQAGGNPLPGEIADPSGFHSDLLSQGDPMVTVTADGTFYIGWDAMNLAFINIPGFGTICALPDGGIAVSKSTDGGRTWSTPVLTGTGVDRPWMVSDLSTGRVYEASSGFVDSSMSTGNPTLPIFGNGISDRWVVSSPDGLHWTTPEPFGGCTTNPPTPATCYSGSGGSKMAASFGEVAATFSVTAVDPSDPTTATNNAACMFFVGTTAPCTVFETSTDSGASWTRHRVPVPSDSTGEVLVAADPTRAGHFSVAVLNSTSTAFLVYTTTDNGTSFTAGATVSDNTTTTKFKGWMNFSPDGVLGLMWRSNVAAPTGAYNVFAAVSQDEGVTFSNPLQVNATPSLAPDPTYNGQDDTSVIALSRQAAFLGWGQWPTPAGVANRAGYFSAIKLQAFNHG
jgi:hypothetical protein